MRRIKLRRVADDSNDSHGSGGKLYEGWEEKKPVVGKRYTLILDSGRVLKTSEVVKVMQGYLVTKNSLFKMEILEDQPFDLRRKAVDDTLELVFPKSANEDADQHETLSPREREIFQLLAEGLTVKECANVMSISPKTVESHKYHIMQKLGIRTMNEWIKEAIRRGIIQVKS